MKRKTLKATAVGLSLMLGVATTVAVRGFFDRPGESALTLVPSSASLIVTEDLVPAPSQLMAFRDIQTALESAGLKGAIANPIGAEIGDPDLLKAVGPYMGKSLAVALYFKNPDTTANTPTLFMNLPGIIFVSLKDDGAAKAALDGLKLQSVGAVHSLADHRVVRISDGYLEVASSPKFFELSDSVKSGSLKSIDSVQTFDSAKAQVDSAANLKFFVQNPGSGAWTTFSGTIKETGIQVLVQGAKDSLSGVPFFKTVTSAKPVSVASLKRIPSDPYLLFSVSQLGQILSSVPSDLGPYRPLITSALKGDAVIGVYPSERAPTAGVDLLIVLDENNGAKPHAAFKELRQKLEEQFLDGEAAFGGAVRIGHVNTYRLTGQLAGMIDQLPSQSQLPNVKSNILFKDKTLAYANDGETLYLCTSERLLKRAIGTADGNLPSVAHDPSFLPFVEGVKSGSQMLLDVNVARILSGLANTTTKGYASLDKAMDDIGVAVNKDAILNIEGGARADGSCHGRAFIPLNYAKLAKIAGGLQ